MQLWISQSQAVQIHCRPDILSLVHFVHIEDITFGTGSVSQVEQLAPVSDAL